MINLINKPTIIGDNVILRPFKPSDISSIEECLTDFEVKKFTGSQTDINSEVITKWYDSRNEQVNRLDLAIEDKNSKEVVGEAVINEYDAETHSMNFRILIGAKGRNRGLGSEATKLICNHIFLNTDLNQLTLSVFAFNARAQRVYEKVGFVIDSIDKEDLEFEGEMIDSINMRLTRDDWEKNRNL